MTRALLLGAWVVVVTGMMAFGSGEGVVRWSIRLALVLALPPLLLMPWLREGGPWEELARWWWTLAWLTYVVHVGLAFHHVHGWSHAEAVAHVERRSGFGEGIWFSHLFTLIGVADVALWWLVPRWRRERGSWVGGAMWGYLGFMTFNATVVYEEGPIRLGGVIFFLLIGMSGAGRFLRGGGTKGRAIVPVSSSSTQHPRECG